MAAGADVEAEDNEGCTPLTWAAREGHAAVARALLQAGAGLTHCDNEGRAALHWAASGGHAAAVHVILAAGANADCAGELQARLLT